LQLRQNLSPDPLFDAKQQKGGEKLFLAVILVRRTGAKSLFHNKGI
jgi:hypothetical protein